MKINTIMCDFSNVKIGDRVYSIRYGEGVVVVIYSDLFVIGFQRYTKSFMINGKESEFDEHPSLFRIEPTLTFSYLLT